MQYSYFHPLNFLRFLLATGVVLFHYGLNYYPFNTPLLKTFIQNSSFRVSFFFFISGFIMSLVYAKQNNIKAIVFYKKRFTRIFPVYWLAFLLTFLLVVFVKQASPKGLSAILNFLGLQSCNPGYVLDLNYPAWSISVELFFYLFFPFVLKWMIKQSTFKLMVCCSLIWILQSAQHIYFVEMLTTGTKKMEEFTNAFPLWHLSTFFTGMCTAKLVLAEKTPQLLKNWPGFLLMLCLIVFAWIIYVPNHILKYIHNGLLSPLFALTIIALYYDRSFLHRFLSHPNVSSLGTVSYGLFIFQYPVWIICTTILNPESVMSSWFFILYYFTLLLFSFLVYRYFEKPLLRYLRKEN